MSLQQSFPTKWNLSKLFKSDNDVEIMQEKKNVEDAFNSFINKWENNTEYLSNSLILKTALDEYEKLSCMYGSYSRESYYFSLRYYLDEQNAELKAKLNTILALSKNLDNRIQFFTHRIAKIKQEDQNKFLNDEVLRPYKHFLEILFLDAKYLLSEDVEKVLNLKSKTSYSNWVNMTSTFLSKETREVVDENGNTTTMSMEEILSLMNSKDKKVRDAAVVAFNSILEKYVEVGEIEVNSVLENKKIDDELRKVDRPDTLRHLADDIPSSVVDTLIESVTERFDISAKYYALKAQLYGVKKLAYHERNLEYGEVLKKYSYEDSVKLVNNVFEKLDPQFAEIFSSFVNDGLIDVFPQKGKRGGAFCAHQLITQPTYILLNHTDQLNDVLTLAHESGHGINNELIKLRQNALNFGTPTSTAEVASTFMEDFVLQELLLQANDEERLSLLMTKLNSDISTIFRQIAAYQFEYALHLEFRTKGYLPKEEIGKIFRKHMSAYMGDAVEQSTGSENWWLYWTHIRYFFYNYSYASGLLISKAMQASVKKDKTFVTNVKEFLSAGRAEPPTDIFNKLGIDISKKEFWLTGLKEVEALLEETTLLAKKLKKIT